MDEYKGFEIVRKGACLYWIIGMGYVMGSAETKKAAMEWVDELCYLEEV